MQASKAIEYSDMPKGCKQSDLSDYIVRLEYLYEQIGDKQRELLNKHLEIEALIAEMPDAIESNILHLRYIEFKVWEQICIDIGYSWKQTHRYHSKALRHINIPQEYIDEIMKDDMV